MMAETSLLLVSVQWYAQIVQIRGALPSLLFYGHMGIS